MSTTKMATTKEDLQALINISKNPQVRVTDIAKKLNRPISWVAVYTKALRDAGIRIPKREKFSRIKSLVAELAKELK